MHCHVSFLHFSADDVSNVLFFSTYSLNGFLVNCVKWSVRLFGREFLRWCVVRVVSDSWIILWLFQTSAWIWHILLHLLFSLYHGFSFFYVYYKQHTFSASNTKTAKYSFRAKYVCTVIHESGANMKYIHTSIEFECDKGDFSGFCMNFILFLLSFPLYSLIFCGQCFCLCYNAVMRIIIHRCTRTLFTCY